MLSGIVISPAHAGSANDDSLRLRDSQAIQGANAIPTEIVTQLADGVSQVTLIGDQFQASIEAGGKVTVPVDAREPIRVAEKSGQSISLSLSEPSERDHWTEHEFGELWLESSSDTKYTLLPTETGFQLLMAISAGQGEGRYDFDLNLPEGAVERRLDDGGVLFINQAGETLFSLAAPWAIDATGKRLPSRFELSFGRLTQVVAFAQDTDFPVVADPYLGSGVFYKSAWVTAADGDDYVVNAVPTDEGRRLNSANVLDVHLAQLKKELGAHEDKVTPTIREQFFCHVVGNYFEPGTYNMESWRPYKDWGTQLNIWDRCNPS